MGSHECSSIGGICTNTIGSYECACESGFEEYQAPAYDFINPETGEPFDAYHVCFKPSAGKSIIFAV